ncbi:MAG: hypothetical protein PX636_16170 [Microcystis sp. M53598_WE2]|nr:hypothetical protein [Microcystis sp. M53598_WE2]
MSVIILALRRQDSGDRRQEIISIYSPHTPHPTPHTLHPTPHYPTPHFPTFLYLLNRI